MLTRQEMFNTAYLGVLAQGKPSFDPHTDACLYRAPNGAKCAVGHLIPDALYSPIAEELTLRDLCQAMPEVLGQDELFLRELQVCHDSACFSDDFRRVTSDEVFLSNFKSRAAKFALKYSLTIPEVPNAV